LPALPLDERYCYRSLAVAYILSACWSQHEPAKMAKTIEMPFGVDLHKSRNHYYIGIIWVPSVGWWCGLLLQLVSNAVKHRRLHARTLEFVKLLTGLQIFEDEAVQELKRTMNGKTCNVALYNSHSIGRECARLVWTDGCCIAHCFTCVKMPHKIIIMHHFLPQTT